ncbi:hypothetical protein FJ656_27505 [Schumannella luteola]|nr:hypothetical protein FJ656_27505 [Schumannella luteola]
MPLAAQPAASPAPVRPHEHGWSTESAHSTSDGIVSYVRCASCGARRVDLAPRGVVAPAPLSLPVA